MSIVLAIVIGFAFGFVLDRIGATNPSVIGRMLALIDLRLMKAIVLAIGVASVLMFGGQMLGLVDVGHMSVKSLYVGVFLGGLMLGVGWGLSGYCPGTGLGAAAAGRRDAWVFVIGGLAGAAAYMATYPFWKSLGVLDGAPLTLGKVPGSKYDALIPALPGDIAGIVAGLVLIGIAFALPERLKPAPVERLMAEGS